eukprot:scpid103735/ scgid3729/ Furin-like protease 1, isoforms 1/1-X/2; Kex2-like endoprotease 1; dKLIP-1
MWTGREITSRRIRKVTNARTGSLPSSKELTPCFLLLLRAKVAKVEQQRVDRRYTRSHSNGPSVLPLASGAAKPGRVYKSPADPYYRFGGDGKQWNMAKRIADPKPAWKRGFTGQGVVVAVVDNGVEYTHQDLRDNYDSFASTDVASFDSNPMPPHSTFLKSYSHGTRCAGEIAAIANDRCVVGLAYNASLGAIRLLGGRETDAREASALSFRRNYTDIYSNSW